MFNLKPLLSKRANSLLIQKMPYPFLPSMKNIKAHPKTESFSKNYIEINMPENNNKSQNGQSCNIKSRCSTLNYNGETIINSDISKNVYISLNKHVLKGDVRIPSYPPLPSPKDESFNNLFKSKIKLCNLIFDFSQENFQINGRKQKLNALIELNSLLSKNKEAILLTFDEKCLLLEMLKKNIFEQDPFLFTEDISLHTLSSNFIEISWEHLSYIYNILIQFVNLFPEMCGIELFQKGIQLLNIPDINERNELVIFLKNYTAVHPEQFDTIWKYVKNVLTNVRFGIYTPFCINPIISYINIIFKSNNCDYLNQILFSHLLPLFCNENLFLFSDNLTNLILRIIFDSYEIHVSVIKYLIKHFPYRSSQKQPLFMTALFSIIKITDTKYLNKYLNTLFKFIGTVLKSPNRNLTELVLQLITDSILQPIILSNNELFMKWLYDPLKWTSSFYWNQSIRNKSQNTLIIFENVQTNSNPISNNNILDQTTQSQNNDLLAKKWSALSRIAAKNNSSIDLKELIFNIQVEFFKNENNKY